MCMYGSGEDYGKVFRWLFRKKPSYMKYLCEPLQVNEDGEVPICNFSEEAERWLWKNCNNRFIRKELLKKYGIEVLRKF